MNTISQMYMVSQMLLNIAIPFTESFGGSSSTSRSGHDQSKTTTGLLAVRGDDHGMQTSWASCVLDKPREALNEYMGRPQIEIRGRENECKISLLVHPKFVTYGLIGLNNRVSFQNLFRTQESKIMQPPSSYIPEKREGFQIIPPQLWFSSLLFITG